MYRAQFPFTIFSYVYYVICEKTLPSSLWFYLLGGLIATQVAIQLKNSHQIHPRRSYLAKPNSDNYFKTSCTKNPTKMSKAFQLWTLIDFEKRAEAECKKNNGKTEKILERLVDGHALDMLDLVLEGRPDFSSLKQKQRLSKLLACPTISSVAIAYMSSPDFIEATGLPQNNISAIMLFCGNDAVATFQIQLKGRHTQHRDFANRAMLVLEGLVFHVPNSTTKAFCETQARFLPPYFTIKTVSSNLGEFWRYCLVENSWTWPQATAWRSFYDDEPQTDDLPSVPRSDKKRIDPDFATPFWEICTGELPEWSTIAYQGEWQNWSSAEWQEHAWPAWQSEEVQTNDEQVSKGSECADPTVKAPVKKWERKATNNFFEEFRQNNGFEEAPTVSPTSMPSSSKSSVIERKAGFLAIEDGSVCEKSHVYSPASSNG